MSVSATVAIATRGRNPELRDLLTSLREQTADLEVLVLDDGESDETRDLVEKDFPEAQYFRLGSNRGPTFQRNRGIELASNNIVFPLDDDTTLPSPKTIEQTLKEFNNPAVAAVAVPFINVLQDDVVRHKPPQEDGDYVLHAFVGASNAVRKDVYLGVGGYREHFFYAGEEGDLCLRFMANGYFTKAGNADPIYHYESPRRNSKMSAKCGRRNDIITVWHNAPNAWLVPSVVMTTINGFVFGAKTQLKTDHWAGLLEGYKMMFSGRYRREPVDGRVYSIFRKLKKHQLPMPADDVMPYLPDLVPVEELQSYTVATPPVT